MTPLVDAPIGMYFMSMLVFGVITALVVLLIGLVPLCSSNSVAATIGEGFARALASVLLFVGLCGFVPWCMKVFNDFDAELPAITILLIDISHFFVTYFFLFVPPTMVAIAVDVWLFNFLHRNPASTISAKWLSASITAAFGVAMLLFVFALLPTFMQLWATLR